jgi:hypothetical protein
MRRLDVAVVAVFGLLSVALAGCQKDDVTTPAMSATCEAQPSSGTAPLAVRFLLSVSGAEGAFTVAVSYGDGTSGSNPDVLHTYAASGSYTASFDVQSAKQSARCAVLVVVSGPSPTPTPSGNQPPKPYFKTWPHAKNDVITGTAPLQVDLNMCLSSDPENDWLFYSIDYDGDGKWDSRGPFGGNCRRDPVYTAGTYRAVLCVHDIDKTRAPLHDDQCHTYTVVATP